MKNTSLASQASRVASRVADEALSFAGTAAIVAAAALRRLAVAAESAAPALHRAAAAAGLRAAGPPAAPGRSVFGTVGTAPVGTSTVTGGPQAADSPFWTHDWPPLPDPAATVTGLICRRCRAVSDEESAFEPCAEPAPLYVPGSCPRCRGKLAQNADGGTWTCGGVPDEAWARALLAGRASALPGGRVTEEHVQELVGRPACGWRGAEETRGDLWS